MPKLLNVDETWNEAMGLKGNMFSGVLLNFMRVKINLHITTTLPLFISNTERCMNINIIKYSKHI